MNSWKLSIHIVILSKLIFTYYNHETRRNLSTKHLRVIHDQKFKDFDFVLLVSTKLYRNPSN